MRACTALLVVTLVSGCSGGTPSAPPAETNDREEKLVLTAEEARQALIEMVENDERGSFLELLLPTLPTFRGTAAAISVELSGHSGGGSSESVGGRVNA